MLEFIIAGFSGSLLSYLISLQCGACIQSYADNPLRRIERNINNFKYNVANDLQKIKIKLSKQN